MMKLTRPFDSQVLIAMLRRPIPEAGMPVDDLDKEKSSWWKQRKWALRIAHRTVARFGDPKICRVDSSMPFAQLFAEEGAAPMLQVLLAARLDGACAVRCTWWCCAAARGAVALGAAAALPCHCIE